MHGLIIKSGYYLKRPGLLRHYDNFQKSQWQSFEWLKDQQEEQLKKLVSFAYENVPYYTKLLNQLGLRPTDIATIKDLEKLPIITKHDIKKNWDDLVPNNMGKSKCVYSSTGGSTGDPLKYRMSVDDYERRVALKYRGWTYAGYRLGDKIAIIAGSSLVPNTKSEIKTKAKDLFFNWRHYSSFQMSEENLHKYFHNINKWKPGFFRGYASSLYLFAKFISDNALRLEFQPKAIFSTSEKLFRRQREVIEQIFRAKVFDNYGLGDGGISAHECEEHCGMHISMERSILEVVNHENKQVIAQQGKILATGLYNYSLPFIRYDTGDMGAISDEMCSCGRGLPLLKEISGRTTEFLKLNNIIIGSPVLTVLMGSFDIDQYHIAQVGPDSVICKIVKGKTYNEKDAEEFIQKSFYSHVGKINIAFEYTDSIPVNTDGKNKFIVNLTESD